MKTGYTFLILFLVGFCSFSQTEVPSFFADHMVLQQKDTVSVWGKDAPGVSIEVMTSWGEALTTKTDENGHWKLGIKTGQASFETQTIHIKGSSTITLKNVLIGEVWFCSGQSNMEMPMKGFDKSPVNRSDTFLATADNANIRLFNADRAASILPEYDIQGAWEQASQKSAREFSAIGYFFGRKLYQELQIPIGIIESSWGGTQIEAWLPKDAVSKYSEIQLPKKLPKDQNKQKKPTALYNAMIHPFQDLGIRGVLWYQGESNRNNPKPYKNYMHEFIGTWRTQWNNPKLPFYLVQIAPYGYGEFRDSPGINANLIREAQVKAAQEIPNTGIVITADVGKCDDIHPPEKEIIALRLANMALAEQYSFDDIPYISPEYKGMHIQGRTARLNFDFDAEPKNGNDFDAKKKISDFVIAGKDQKFYPAQVTVNNDQTLTVQSDRVEEPVAVRYGFVDCLEGSLFSSSGLPVSPFRTDSWEE